MDKKYTVKITNIVKPDDSARTFYLEKPRDMEWTEGTNLHVALPGFDEGEVPDKSRLRHLSLMTLPGEGVIALTTRVPGSGSPFKRALENLKVGDRLVIFKPSSRMPLRREGKRVVLVSMGVGITAFRTIIMTYLADRSGIPSLTNINVDRREHFILREELDRLVCEGYGNFWEKDRKALNSRLGTLEYGNSLFYLVGSDEFLADLCLFLLGSGVPRENIVMDKKPEKNVEILDGAEKKVKMGLPQ